MLRQHGHEVEVFERHSDDLRKMGVVGKLKGAAMTPWNPIAARELRALALNFNPDVIHAHNTFPMISPAIFFAMRGWPRVLTLHNYRLVCPAAIPMRDNKTCTKCIDQKSVIPSLRHGCYRESRVATVPLALNVALHRMLGTWTKQVDAFITLSQFQKDIFVGAGLPEQRICIKPNFYPGTPNRVPYYQRPQRIVFAGRISGEKGVDDLVEAWMLWGKGAPELRIIGDGPLREILQARAAQAENIVFCGALSSSDTEIEISKARLLLVPSRWFEGFPMVIREAIALGVPIGVSDIGPLPQIASDVGGIVFPPGDARALISFVKIIWENPAQLAKISKNCEAAFERLYSESVNYEKLISIYRKAIESARVN